MMLFYVFLTDHGLTAVALLESCGTLLIVLQKTTLLDILLAVTALARQMNTVTSALSSLCTSAPRDRARGLQRLAGVGAGVLSSGWADIARFPRLAGWIMLSPTGEWQSPIEKCPVLTALPRYADASLRLKQA